MSESSVDTKRIREVADCIGYPKSTNIAAIDIMMDKVEIQKAGISKLENMPKPSQIDLPVEL